MELDWFLKASSGKTTEQKVNDLTELMFKVMETVVNVMDTIEQKIKQLNQKIMAVEENIRLDKARGEGEMNTIKTWLKSLEGRAVAPGTGGGSQGVVTGAPSLTPSAPITPTKPKPAPKPLPTKPISGQSARTALQSELKDLFARMKKAE